MPTATTPPVIAPGVLCPKCKGPMLDERATKRSDKSPDYTCANMTCVSVGANGKSYRTAIWADKADVPKKNGAPPVAAVPMIDPVKKPTMREAYKQLTEWVISDIAPLYATDAGETDLSADTVAAITATLFIQACKAGKVE